LVAVTHRVRRRVQVLSLLTIAGWVAVLAALWELPARGGTPVAALSVRWIALGAGLATLVLLVFSILQVRRLPRADAHPLHRYPRRAG
jgi:hypothetical protein